MSALTLKDLYDSAKEHKQPNKWIWKKNKYKK